MEEKQTAFPEVLYFGRYRDDCLVLWDGTEENLQQLYIFINTLNPDLKFTMEIGNQSNQLKLFKKVLLLDYVVFVVVIMIIQLSPY